MRSRGTLVAIIVGLVVWSSPVAALEFREEPYRVGIVDVGEPILLNYTELTNEMGRNNELRDWIESYGRPEYAEYQKVEMNDPFLPYEVRLYYIEGRRYVAFGAVTVAPAVRDFGVRKYIGKLDSVILQRLLTARPDIDNSDTIAAASVGAYEGGYYVAPANRAQAMEVGEEIVVEEVIVLPASPEVVIVENASEDAPAEAVVAAETGHEPHADAEVVIEVVEETAEPESN